jgi:hypothetical protein
MHAALLNSSLPYAPTLVAGLLMVRIAFAKQRLESRQRTRWCASYHRRTSGRGCGCSSRR